MKRILLATLALGTLAACDMPNRDYDHYGRDDRRGARQYEDGYTYHDRGYWSPEYTSYRTSTSPEGRWMYERGRNQRN